MHSMPGRFEPMAETEQQLAEHRISQVLCLTPLEEIATKSPEYAAALEAGVSWSWKHVPVPDFGVPADLSMLFREVEACAALLQAGQSVLIHCAAGIGRTGLAASLVLMALGLPREQALEVVHKAGSGSETTAQHELLRGYLPRPRAIPAGP